MKRPLVHDLFCGLGGWTEGFLEEGYDAIGWDIEQHAYGTERYPGLLVVQDVLTIHGAQLKDADVIVGSSPCQEYSYMAMPWSRAKAKRTAILADQTGEARRRLNALFDAQFRIQREASEAAGRHIPLVVENVRGAQEWVGRAAWNFGSYYLWGDVPALMPKAIDARKVPGFRFDGVSKKCFQQVAADRSREAEGRKNGNDWFGSGENCSLQRRAASGSKARKARKAASATVAKIPLQLSRHIARVYRP